MATREEQVIVHGNLRVVCVKTIGHNEELSYPDGTDVPEGRQEILWDVKEVEYNAKVGGQREPDWQTFNHDVGRLERENEQLKADKKELAKKNASLQKRLETLGIVGKGETDAKD